MARPPTQLLVAWSGADPAGIRDLLVRGRLPVIATRLSGMDRLVELPAPPVSPFALALTLATGLSPADHGLLAPVQPSPDGRAWLPVQAARLPAAPWWDRLAAAGIPVAVIGWPGTHGTAPHPGRWLASDLDLIAVDVAHRPLEPMPGADPEIIRIAPGELDPALLGFFIPRDELPANPAADPAVGVVLRWLAPVYSAHNTAVARLQADTPPAVLVVHFELPAFPPVMLRRHPRLREAAWRLLDLLLGDLLQQVPGAGLTLAGLAPGNAFIVGSDEPAPTALTGLGPGLLGKFGLSPNHAALPPSAAVDDAPLLQRYHTLGQVPDSVVAQPPPAVAHLHHQFRHGRLLLAEQRPAEALPRLAPAWFDHPEDTARALPLYECLHALGLRDEAAEPAAALRDHARTGPWARLVEAELLLRHRAEPARALELLAPLRADPALGARASALYREALLHLRRFAEARPLLESAVAGGAATADTHAGLAYACFHLGEFLPAEAAARAAIARGSRRPQPAHILEHLAARRARQPMPNTMPGWDVMLADAARREDQREAYARLRAAALAVRAGRRAAQAPVAFTTGSPAVPADAVWTIITGLPRSGLSLLARMLAFGGHPVLTDGVRRPDAHNPCGYFEWTPAAHLGATPRLIDEAANHALKLPAAALDLLPRDRRYRVLFVTRDPGETALSQAAVRGIPPPSVAAVEALAQHLARRLAEVRADPAFDLLEIPYAELCAEPASWATRLVEFLGAARLRRPDAMPGAVHPDLPRHRRP